MANRSKIIALLREKGVPEYKVIHSELVADVALIVARRVMEAGFQVDLDMWGAGSSIA